ncbi:hypothetical protein [Haloferula sp. BvORR071]|uniref:hypothetical protein n=1 Tax=Haloferula sp. BvORR071 TaxID=1396141 RepID=UPI000558C2A7|nr:hypothetical protein [Haloferula sp. BvORR071]
MDRGSQKTAPGISEYVAALIEAASLWRQIVQWCCALLPLGLMLGLLATLCQFGWPSIFSGSFLAVLWPIFLALSCVWYRFAMRTPRSALLAGVFAGALGLTCAKIDWMLVTSHQDEGVRYRQSMFEALPPAPLWRRPTPEQFRPGAKSWRDCVFSAKDDDGSSMGVPSPVPNWLLIWLRLLAYTIIPFAGLSGLLAGYAQCRHWILRFGKRWLQDEPTFHS